MRKRPTVQSRQPGPFTMIEITLALGVIAIGVVAILGMFPIGANASRDAIAETYAAETAEQMMDFIESTFRNDWTVGQTTVPVAPPKPNTDYNAGTRANFTNGTIYGVAGTPGKYRVIRFVNRDDSTDPGDLQPDYTSGDILDFDTVAVVWRDTVTVPDASGSSTSVDTQYAVAVNIEVSWPAQLPYSARRKALYVKELFKR